MVIKNKNNIVERKRKCLGDDYFARDLRYQTRIYEISETVINADQKKPQTTYFRNNIG